MHIVATLRNFFRNAARSTQLLAEIREGIANLTGIVVRTSNEARSIDLQIRKGVLDLFEASPPAGFTRKFDDPDQSRPRSGAVRPVASSPTALTPKTPYSRREFRRTNDLASYVGAFEGQTPYSGTPEVGFYPDWTGAMTDAAFREWTGMKPSEVGGKFVRTELPTISQGEGWFESVEWVEAAREASRQFIMVTLGACYGAQAVGSYRVLQMINPMPCKLVAVEPEPENQEWLRRHFLDNGIDPDDHWIVGSAISDTRQPVFFPVGAPGTGAQNCFSTNELGAREAYVTALAGSDQRDVALRNLLLNNSTGLTKSLTGDGLFNAEIKLVSAVTLNDILSPFDRIDYVEVDIQQSEIIVIPPFMDLLKKKVRRIHVGTHGKDVHDQLARLFRRDEWEIIFDYAPNTDFETPYGNFSMNDGVLTARNPRL